MKNNNTFDGPGAILEYLLPNNSTVPMVELPEYLNPFHKKKVRIRAQVWGDDYHIKHVPAYMMLKNAKDDGLLDGVHTLVENTSGNTVTAIKYFAPHFGIKNVVAIIPKDLAQGKLQTIQRLGLDTMNHNGKNGVAIARELGKKPGWFNLGQYDNPANPMGHFLYTGPKIWAETKGKIRILATAGGTMGTLCGTSRFFREALGREKFTSVAVICAPGNMIPGARSREALKEISFAWEAMADAVMEVGTAPANFVCQRLSVVGLRAGPSSGLAYRGLLDFLHREESDGKLDSYRNKEGVIEAVVIFPDGPDKYVDKIVTLVDQETLSTDTGIPS